MVSLSKRCGSCVRNGSRCEPVDISVDFNKLDKALEELESERANTEALLARSIAAAQQAQAKLQRLRRQKKFLKQREQKLYESGLDDSDELVRLEELERVNEVQQAIDNSSSLDDFLSGRALSPNASYWLGAGAETVGEVLDNS
jgi:Rad3-related DNA helicase